MEPFWRGVVKLEPQQYLAIRNNLWMGQDRQLWYQSHLRSFQQCLWDIYWQKTFFTCNLKANQDGRSMEGSRNNVEQSGTDTKPASQVKYETANIGACKT